MSIRLQADVKTEGVSHAWFPNTGSGFGTIEFGRGNRLYFNGTEDVDELIAELVALKQEMAPPVITDSERDCYEVNPDGGWHCNRYGPHDWHHDDNGDTWRTDDPEPEPTLHQKRLQAVREGRPEVQDGPYAYVRQDA